ncbi:MAG: aminoacyl-tRNA hydrolase [Catenisphaera adipataccumulans]|jgi:PTH1 family peptidyl-tRNA hydrolase|uniref:aminoacyl-tRNA hydrolase n=1 Tax=Catenisphaera adipataccumulans TaxID=700500 RepID=UPI003D8E8137
MKVIVGLGNPGLKYRDTRHNTGFMVMDRLAELCHVSFEQEKFEAYFVKTKIEGEDVILMKPTTYMNNSGFAVRQVLDFYKLSPDHLLVIYDDIDLSVGRIRLRQKGSAGGHNGIKSIISCIFTEQFDRIRVGIGRDPRIRIVDWVLSRFRPEEKEPFAQAVDLAAQAAYYSITHSFVQTMNEYNGR